MESTFSRPNAPKPSDLRFWPIDEADNSSHEFSDEDQDQLVRILHAYESLSDQGFYEPHARVTP